MDQLESILQELLRTTFFKVECATCHYSPKSINCTGCYINHCAWTMSENTMNNFITKVKEQLDAVSSSTRSE